MTKFYTEGAGHIKEEWGFPDTSSNYLTQDRDGGKVRDGVLPRGPVRGSVA